MDVDFGSCWRGVSYKHLLINGILNEPTTQAKLRHARGELDSQRYSTNSNHMEKQLHFRLFFELPYEGYEALFLWKFQYDEETDWYEGRVFRGDELAGYMHGYANRGWNPQVNNIWVAERFRRKGIASEMMARIESFFGQAPLPGTRVEDNPAAKAFWDKYLSGRHLGARPRDPWQDDMGKRNREKEPTVRFRFYFRLPVERFETLFLLEFRYDENTDWYESRVFRGGDLVGYLRGHANPGWNPQVTQVWVAEKYRRAGMASIMMSKVEGYFGQVPLPAFPCETDSETREFWRRYASDKDGRKSTSIEPEFDPAEVSKGQDIGIRIRHFFEFPSEGQAKTFKLDFYYDEALNWFEARVLHEGNPVGLMHGLANVGWNPQVTYIWVSADYRKQGIATAMMSRVHEFFGQVPLPAIPLDDRSPAKALWGKFMARRRKSRNGGGGQVAKARHVHSGPEDSTEPPPFSNDQRLLCCPECGAILKSLTSEQRNSQR